MAGDLDGVETGWPLRTWVLAILGALLAFAIERLVSHAETGSDWSRRLVGAGSIFLGIAGTAFGLSWQPRRAVPAVCAALLCGFVAGGVFLWNGLPGEGDDTTIWHLVCGLGAVAFLLVLFQAAQDRASGRWPGRTLTGLRDWAGDAIHYPDVHGHLWTNALLLGASLLFALITFGIAHLLAEMFWLVKLGFLRAALREPMVVAALNGGAFGAAIGLLRDRASIIAALRRVAMIVLRVLAPVLAGGILVFLLALPFTGLAPLWETGGTTPLMLAGAVLALFLANAVIGDQPEDETHSKVLGAAAAILCLVLVPMVAIAAFSSGLRIHQHGLSPDRLWALAFIIVAGIVAVAYAAAPLHGRGWFARLRRGNLRLVYLLAGIGLLLSTPLLGFERIATANQLARLASGRVAPEAFDYKALWFDFGPPGRAAIEQLAAGSPDATVRRYARETRTFKDRWALPPNDGALERGAPLDRRLTVLPRPVPIDDALRARIVRPDACGLGTAPCTLRHVPGEDFAIVISGPPPRCEGCVPGIALIRKENGAWLSHSISLAQGDRAPGLAAAIRAGDVTVRPVQRRQIVIGGEAMDETLPPENAGTP